jgi:hypothetical protein
VREIVEPCKTTFVGGINPFIQAGIKPVPKPRVQLPRVKKNVPAFIPKHDISPQVIMHLFKERGTMQLSEIAKELYCSGDYVSVYLQAMLLKGLIRRVSRGRYELKEQ